METRVSQLPTAGKLAALWSPRRVLRSLTLTPLLVLMVASVGVSPAQAAESCPNAAARQGPSIDLPECRAYEQVTPVDKGDAMDIFTSSPSDKQGIEVALGNEAFVAEEGGAILVQTHGSFTSEGAAGSSGYVFSRGAEGWHMSVLAQSIDEPQEVEEEHDLFDPTDLFEVAFRDRIGTQDDLSALQHTGLVGSPGGPYASVFSISGFNTGEGKKQIEAVGGSEDLSRVVLEGEDHSLAPGAEAQDAGSEAIYETSGGGECGAATSDCKLVDVNGEGAAMECGATLGQGELGSGGAHTAVSSDGSRIVFTAPEPKAPNSGGPPEGVGCWNPGTQENPPEVYVREDGSRTVEVSVPQEALPHEVGSAENPLLPAVFVGASGNGSKVFFMTRTELTSNAVGHDPELYEYNFEPEKGEKNLTLVSGNKAGTVEGDVDNVTAVSSDGSTVYFSAFGKLVNQAQEYNPPGTGDFSPLNLYRYDTITGETTYVTKLNKSDYPMQFGQEYNWYTNELGGEGAELEGLTYEKEWYTTDDGRFLVFGTALPLTGFDNTHAPGVNCPTNYGTETPAGCFELYRYDAVTGSIVCVSCAGGAPIDGAYFARTYLRSPAAGTPRPISENGEDVFFESANALVSQAVPGRDHVYEWHDGTISLISSPSDPGNAIFLGSSAEGQNVFFVTHAQLVAEDTDQSADIYDARVDGGFAGVTPPACTGTGCQGVPAAPPVFATPASVTFEGVGNFPSASPPAKPASKPKAKPKKCAKGKKLTHGKCVTARGKAKRRKSARKQK